MKHHYCSKYIENIFNKQASHKNVSRNWWMWRLSSIFWDTSFNRSICVTNFTLHKRRCADIFCAAQSNRPLTKASNQIFMQAPFNAIRRTANTLSCSTELRLSFLLVNLKRVWYFGTTAMNGCTIDAHHHRFPTWFCETQYTEH